jgi:hypothetical protein
MAKQKKEVVAKAAAQKPVAKAAAQKESSVWDSLEEKLNEFEKKNKGNGYLMNTYLNPLKNRFENGERSASLEADILKLDTL